MGIRKMKTIAIVVVALALGVGIGYLFRAKPWIQQHESPVTTGDFKALYTTHSAKIVFYSLSTCPACNETRELLQSTGIPFTERTIDKSPGAQDEADELGIGGVPVLFIGKYRIDGFNRAKISQLIDEELAPGQQSPR